MEETNQPEDSALAEAKARATPQNHSKKRKRGEGSDKVNHLAKAYENISFQPRISEPSDIQIPGVEHVVTTTRPGSPSRQFKHSYFATLETNNNLNMPKQVVHQHANGLCVVTVGLLPKETKISKIEFLVSTADACSAGERRKRQSKMLQKGNAKTKDSSGIVTPDVPLANLTLQDGTTVPLYACVWGSILELNTNVTPQLLQEDPLLNGYLAVILPTGPFPLKECMLADGGDADGATNE